MGTPRITSSQSSPTVTFSLEADVVQTDLVNRRWLVRFYLRMSKPSGSFYGGAGNQIGRYNNVEFGRVSGNPFLPSGSTSWNQGPFDVWLPATAAGYWTGTLTSMPLSMQLAYGTINTTPTGSITLPRIGNLPPAPNPLPTTPDQITATSMRYQFSSAGDGGSPVVRYEYQYSTSPTFASGNSAILTNGFSGTAILTGLTPSTAYYQRSRTVNGIGTGPWSTITTGTTLAGSPPGMVVAPTLDGASAVVTLTPPPDIPSPTGYRLEYRLVGGIATSIDVGASTTVSPLTPGATYEWRAAARSGAYTGPFTAWTTVTQPNTNTNPGDYIDGATPARTDVTYAWFGTANNSTSRAIGKAVAGWGDFASGAAVSGGSGTVTRVTGGRSQQFAARIEFLTPTAAAGFHAGTAYTAGSTFEALQGAVYDGLIHVLLPVRGQRLAAMFVWLNAARAEIGRSVGVASNVGASSSVWSPLRVSGTPPFGAVWGAIRVIDVAGEGWSLWAAGDRMLLDDAITPFADYYFDGNTPDTVEWDYSWQGAVNGSVSQRLDSTTPIPSPLIDPDCPPVPAPPRPPDIPDSCVEEDTTEWRRFWQEIPSTFVPTWTDTVPILKIETTTPVRLVRVRYYPNPFNRPLSALETDSFCSEQIISFIPGDATFTLDGVSQRAFAEMDGSSTSLSADSLLRGDSSVWPGLGCGISYYVTIDVPTDTPTNALELSYSLVPRY
jgi:hypothetical protein